MTIKQNSNEINVLMKTGFKAYFDQKKLDLFADREINDFDTARNCVGELDFQTGYKSSRCTIKLLVSISTQCQ